jgi:uncharacterized membrane protein (DUF373 family)
MNMVHPAGMNIFSCTRPAGWKVSVKVSLMISGFARLQFMAHDKWGRDVYLAESEYSLRMAREKYPDIRNFFISCPSISSILSHFLIIYIIPLFRKFALLFLPEKSDQFETGNQLLCLVSLIFQIMAKKVQTFSQKAERFIIYALVVMMATVLVLATIELAYHIIMSVITPPILLLNFDDILDLFGIFLLVLIGIELLDTIKIYFKRNIVHVEVVVLVAIIAISRKVIVLEVGDYPPGP